MPSGDSHITKVSWEMIRTIKGAYYHETYDGHSRVETNQCPADHPATRLALVHRDRRRVESIPLNKLDVSAYLREHSEELTHNASHYSPNVELRKRSATRKNSLGWSSVEVGEDYITSTHRPHKHS